MNLIDQLTFLSLYIYTSVWMSLTVRKWFIYLSGYSADPQTGPQASFSRDSNADCCVVGPWALLELFHWLWHPQHPPPPPPHHYAKGMRFMSTPSSVPRKSLWAGNWGSLGSTQEFSLGEKNMALVIPTLILSFLFCKMGIFSNWFNKHTRPCMEAFNEHCGMKG